MKVRKMSSNISKTLTSSTSERERIRKRLEHLISIDDAPSRPPPTQSEEKDSSVEKTPQQLHDESEKNANKRHYAILVLTIVIAIGLFYEPREIRGFLHDIIFHGHGPFNRIVKPWINEEGSDVFNGRFKTSRISTVTYGWNKRVIWLSAIAYENESERSFSISGSSNDGIICAGNDEKLSVQIKIDDEIHIVPTRLSKDKSSLIFEHPEKWIEKVSNSKKVFVKIDDDCGTQTYLIFRIKGEMDLSW